ncbi:hypothetical protein [Taurinivorans muris]
MLFLFAIDRLKINLEEGNGYPEIPYYSWFCIVLKQGADAPASNE